VTLVHSTLVEMVIPEAPQNLVGDNAYDSDKLDDELRQYGIEVIAPHRSNRKNKLKTGVGCADIIGAGKSKDCLPGFKTSAGSLRGSSAMPRTSSVCLLHLGSCLILLRHL